MQKVRHPKQIKPPDRLGDELRRRKRPSLPVPNQFLPREARHRRRGIAANVGQLPRVHARMLPRLAIQEQPKYEPYEAQRAGDDESPSPAPAQRDWRHYQRSDDRTYARPRVEDPYR